MTVNVNAGPPAVALDGDNEPMVGVGVLIVNDAAFDVPPEAGFVTVTLVVPAVAISAAVMAADNCVELTKVVFFTTPLNFATAPDTKPEPLSVNVNAGPPALAFEGDSEVMEKLELLIAN